MNFHHYLNRQNNEDRRAFVIHYPAKSGKTSFARRICETRNDARLLDLQRYFLEHPELPPVQQCDASMLDNLLLSLDRQTGALRWIFRPEHAEDSRMFGFGADAVIGDGRLFAVDLEGVVYAFDVP